MIEYKSVEEINAHYDGQIAAAEDAAKPGLDAERWRTIAGYHQAEVVQRDLLKAKGEAINKYPRARTDEVRGASPEELEASAKASHDHVEGVLAAERERMETELRERVGTSMYGPGSGAAGGTTGGPPTTGSPNPEEDRVQSIMARVRSGNGRVTEEEEQLVARVRLLPATQRLDMQWVLDEAAKRGINLPTLEDILK